MASQWKGVSLVSDSSDLSDGSFRLARLKDCMDREKVSAVSPSTELSIARLTYTCFYGKLNGVGSKRAIGSDDELVF